MGSNRVRVLAVEDNPADLRLLKEHLSEASSMDFELVGAGTLQEAILLLSTDRFAVVLLDLNLPDSVGLGGIEKILATPAAPSVIVLTGLDSEETGLQALSQNAQDYLVKGRIDSDMLVRSIRYAIQRDQAEKAVRKMNAELRAVNERLSASRLAALNLMEDAIHAQEQVKQINFRLRESELRLNRAQEIAHLGSWELNLLNNQLTWSDEVYRIFGFQAQEFGATYAAFLEAVHPDDRATVDDAYSGSTRDGRDTYEIEHRVVRHSDGEIRIVHEKCEHFRDETGRIVRSGGMVHDITERKRAEQALRAAHDELELRVQERTKELAFANQELSNEIYERKEVERQLRIQTTAMEAAANGILITDHRGNIQWTNPALAEISGYDPRDLLGESTRIFNSGKHDDTYYLQLWETILSGNVWRGETINRRKDGTLYIEEQTITPVRDESGQIPHFIAIKQDITERKQAQQELEKRNEELRALSEVEHYQRQLSEALVKAALVLNQSLKLDEVLSIILEQIKQVIPYQLADVIFLEGDTFYDASHQGDLDWPSNLSGIHNRFELERFPLFDKMRQSGEPVLIMETQDELEWVKVVGLTWVRSFLSAPLLVEAKVIGFVNLFSNQPGFFTQGMSNLLVAFAAHASAAIQNAWLFERVQASTERLHSLSRRLVEVQETERLYISRELHDEAGQMLTSLLVDLRLLEKNISQPNAMQKIITTMESSLNDVIENLHRIAMALRPASLDHVGLVVALRQHAELLGEKHGLQVNFISSGVEERLLPNVETVVYRVVQEALTNVVRHAQASRVDVVLTVRDDKLIVIVEDDGIGFDPEAVSSDEHLGLFGMRERTEMVDGKLIIESASGKGTTIMMEVGYDDSVIGRR